MRAFAAVAGRLLPLGGLAGVSALSGLHSVVGVVTAVLTAIYTCFIAIEAALRVAEKLEARKLAKGSPRTRADA